MRLLALLIAAVALSFLVACCTTTSEAKIPPSPLPFAEPNNSGGGSAIVVIHIMDNGISTENGRVIINKMHPGAAAEAIYRVYNETVGEVRPDIFTEFDEPSRYGKTEGYSSAPAFAAKWVKLPETYYIPPGESTDFIVSLEIPKGKDDIPGKWAYKVGISDGTTGGPQASVSVWWLVSMR